MDVMTGFIEMANICSVPMNFGHARSGIKLTSYVAKNVERKIHLIPDIEKKYDGGYEGAIVLDPKCDCIWIIQLLC